jgi:hypothetical protein
VGRSTRDSSVFACDQTDNVCHTRPRVLSRAVASCQLLSCGIDRSSVGNSPVYFEVAASSSFQHQSQTERQSDQSFDKEHNFLGDWPATTEHRPLVNDTASGMTSSSNPTSKSTESPCPLSPKHSAESLHNLRFWILDFRLADHRMT